MNAFSDLILNALSGTLAQVGEVKLEAVLQNLHDHHPADYELAIRGGHALVKALQPLVAGTGTKIDDAIVNALSDAISASAAANNIQL